MARASGGRLLQSGSAKAMNGVRITSNATRNEVTRMESPPTDSALLSVDLLLSVPSLLSVELLMFLLRMESAVNGTKGQVRA